MVSAGLDKFFVIIGINRMIGKGLVMAVPGLDPGIVPAIHAVMLQNSFANSTPMTQPIVINGLY
jgi:hypothetical protein